MLGVNSLRVQPEARAGLEPGVPSAVPRTGGGMVTPFLGGFNCQFSAPGGKLSIQLPPAEEAGEAERWRLQGWW